VPLLLAARTLPTAHSNPYRGPFIIAISIVGVYALAAAGWVYVRPVTTRFMLGTTALDVSAISVLVAFSGGPFSQARLAYFLVPVAVAFRFRPFLTAIAGAATVVAYLAQAFAHPATREEGAYRFIAIQTGYLVWLSLAALLLSSVLKRRTTRIAELAEVRRRLITDALTAEERERRALAEGLHDSAIQNLLSARHDIDEAAESSSGASLGRADTAIEQTIAELREAIFELHPYVLEQAGLIPALRAVAQRAARRGGFAVHLEMFYPRRHPHEALLLAAARELLANVVRHAHAANVTIRLLQAGSEVVLEIVDDGAGFDRASLPERLAEGHIGLRSQLERIENVGGTFDLRSAPGDGTTVRIGLPV
jgi:two-component system, NarL family, sensor kinase